MTDVIHQHLKDKERPPSEHDLDTASADAGIPSEYSKDIQC